MRGWPSRSPRTVPSSLASSASRNSPKQYRFSRSRRPGDPQWIVPGFFSFWSKEDPSMLKLDVVNRCIGTLGKAPLLTLDEVHTFAPAALHMLELTNQEVQSPGRWFNSVLLPLTPSGYVAGLYLPGDTLEVVTGDPRYVQRGDRIYKLDTGDF